MSKHPAFEIQRNLQETSIPSNVQLEKGIDTAKQALDSEISKRGTKAPESKLAQDASQLLETSKQFIQEKNEGELLQTFIADTKDAIQELTTQMNSQEFWIQRTKFTLAAQKHISSVNQLAQINVDAMKSLALTLVNSSEFRSLINEFINMAQSMVDIEQSRAGPLPSLTPESTGTVPLTEEAKLKAQQLSSVGKQVFQDISQGKVEIPEDRKLAIRQKFRNLINRLNAEPSFQESINGLFYLMDQIQFYALQLKQQAQQQTQVVQGQINTNGLWKMWSDGKAFIANFTGTQLLDTLTTDCYNFFNLVWNDQRLSQFFWDLRNFITAVIQNPSLFDSDDFVQKWNDLYAYGYQWMNDPRYRDSLWSIYSDFTLISVAFQKDTLTQQLQQDINRIARDLVLDESGKPSLNIMSAGLANLKSLVFPVLKKYLENVPIPAFSGSNDTYDWQVQQMYVNAATLVPDNIEIKVWGDAQVSLTDQPSKANTYITMWIRDVGFHAKDLRFHFTRKSIPRLDETGIADVCIVGKGSTLKIVWRIVGDQSTQWVWSVHQVRCDIRDLDITIKESTHTWLMKFVTSLFSGSIRRNIEDKIELSIGEGLGTINEKLNEAVQSVPTII